MNKKIFALCLCGLMTMGMTACQAQNGETTTTTAATTTAAETTAAETTAAEQTEASQETEEATADVLAIEHETINKIIEANTLDNLLKKYDTVAATSISYNPDGEETSRTYFYGDADYRVAEYPSGSVLIIGTNDSYGFDAPSSTPYVTLFAIEEEYNEYRDYYRDNLLFVFDLDEYVKGESTADGITTIETYIDVEAAKNYFSSDDLISMGDFTSYVSSYKVDAETYELISLEAYVGYEDGSKKTFAMLTVSTNTDKYTPSEELYAATHGEGRVFTAVLDPDTENERTFTYNLPKGAGITYYPPIDYYDAFSDRECTQILEPSNDYDSDVTLYYALGK